MPKPTKLPFTTGIVRPPKGRERIAVRTNRSMTKTEARKLASALLLWAMDWS